MEEELKVYKMEKILNYINGELVEPKNGKYLNNFNPSTGKPYSLIPDSRKEDIDIAGRSCKSSFITWSKTPKQKRSDILMKLADNLEKHFDELVKAESKDNGKLGDSCCTCRYSKSTCQHPIF